MPCSGRLLTSEDPSIFIPDCFEFHGQLRVGSRVERKILCQRDVSRGMLLAESRHSVSVSALAELPVDVLVFFRFVVHSNA